jgi:DNA polymerase-1
VAKKEKKKEKKKKKGRPGLLTALKLHGLQGIEEEQKGHWRQVILENEEYTEEQWRGIEWYNRTDVDATIALLDVMGSAIDWPHALLRGRYMAAVARMERVGLPVDRDRLITFVEHWGQIKLHFIERDDEFGLYNGLEFDTARFWDLVDERGWDWPRTAGGQLELKNKTLREQAQRYPELRKFVQLREHIAELRINKLMNTVGPDGFSRIPLLPFWTNTGRNQPSARDKMFLPGLPAWLHGLIKPPPGYAIFEIDWDAQEVGLMAGLSGDPDMIEDFRTDPYFGFGKRAKLVPEDASKKNPEHRDYRNKILKPVVLGQNYGMTPHGIANKTGKSMQWSRTVHMLHHLVYSVFHNWLGDTVAQAKFNRVIRSPYGWPQHVTGETSDRVLMNFPAQAGAADMMRITAIAATEAGIQIAAPVHDAFWVLCPIAELDATIERMTDIMRRAAMAVTGGLPIGASVEAKVIWPHRLGDVREESAKGQKMWCEVNELVAGFQKGRRCA